MKISSKYRLLLYEPLSRRSGSEPIPRRCRPTMPNQCCMTRMVKPYVNAPYRGVTLGAFICGSFFAEVPDINSSEFINVWASQNSIVASLFAEAPQINCHLFINNRRAKYPSASGIHIRSPAPSFRITENTPRVEV